MICAARGAVRRRILLLAVAALACGTTKSYDGPRLAPSEEATLHAARTSGGGTPFSRAKTVHICEVDGKLVGSYFRGYPPVVRVLPGERRVKLQYFDSKLHGSGSGAVALGILGGAIGGAIAGAASAGRPGQEYRTLSFEALPGASYIVEFDTAAENPAMTAIWITDKASGQTVSMSRVGISSHAPGNELREWESVPREQWRAIASEAEIRAHTRAGGVHHGRMSGYDGEYLWIMLSTGGKKALSPTEVLKLERSK
jgi:hypothetical protein